MAFSFLIKRLAWIVPSARQGTVGIRSIYVTCLLLVALSTAIVAGSLHQMAVKTEKSIAIDGLRTTANDVGHLLANGFKDSLLVGKTYFVEQQLDSLFEVEQENLHAALVMDSASNVIASVGMADDAHLKRLAETAMLTGLTEYTGDNLWIAIPIFKGTTSEVAAVFASAWTADPLMAKIDARNADQIRVTTGIFLAVFVLSAIMVRFVVSRPLRAVAQRTILLAEGNLNRGVPGLKRNDEIGEIARSLEELRARLFEASEANRNSVFQSAGFQASSAALLMTDAELIINHHNAALRSFVRSNAAAFEALFEGGTSGGLTGKSVANVEINGISIQSAIAQGNFPIVLDLSLGDRTVFVKINDVQSANQNGIGFVIELEDITDAHRNKAIISALENGQMRADFDAKGRLLSYNDGIALSLSTVSDDSDGAQLTSVLSRTAQSQKSHLADYNESVFDRFRITDGHDARIASGSVSPTRNRNGDITGYVFLGNDISEAETARETAQKEAQARTEEQRAVVDALTDALTTLSQGDLSVRITEKFGDSYEGLRNHFNASLQGLDDAVALVLENAQSILGESGNIANAADDLSKRTERQATTLEQFAAALAQITASVASAADGAMQAKSVVSDARTNAKTSGAVVREAIDAMGEISASSEQISRIIGVIDDIAFQTNLLALNAGVEAARAGDAGRGFAVVASEVRALAQRSSDAARAINALISTSGTHVKQGVGLVDKTGEALTEIVDSIAGVADHVTTIAASSREQSVGLDEINTAIGQLDQVTQQNVAMFEEMTAASHTLREEATALVKATGHFILSETNTTNLAGSKIEFAGPPDRTDEPISPPDQVAYTDGATALALEFEDDDWEDF